MPDEGRREGSLVKSAAALATARLQRPPKLCPSRQPTGVRRRRSGSVSGSCGVRAVSAARAALWGRLEPVQEVLTGRPATGVSSVG